MIGTLTALQWFIYDSVKVFFRLPRPPPPEEPESLKQKRLQKQQQAAWMNYLPCLPKKKTLWIWITIPDHNGVFNIDETEIFGRFECASRVLYRSNPRIVQSVPYTHWLIK